MYKYFFWESITSWILVICFYFSFARKIVLKIPYISLVNLVAGEEVVPELVAEQMNPKNVRQHLASILPGGSAREAQLQGYERMVAILGEPGAPNRAAKEMVKILRKNDISTSWNVDISS